MVDAHQISRTKYKRLNSHPTVGFLTCGFSDSYALWSGIHHQAQKKAINLICFPGNPPNSPIEFESQANAIYDLINTDYLDGLLIWGAGLSVLADFQKVKALYDRFRPIPTVSISLGIEGIPNISIDNYQGVREMMAHLIKEHGYHRIAFIRGPEDHFEAEERYRAYRDALADFELTFDPSLVVTGNFKEQSGDAAVNFLHDQLKIRFDAILAANDLMALGAMKSLLVRKIRIPEEVAVAGFDNIEDSKYVSPSLTTLRQPFYEMGSQAMEMLSALLEGQKIPEQVLLPTELMIRHSCACKTSTIIRATVGAKEVFPEASVSCEAEPLKETAVSFEAQRAVIIAELMKTTESSLLNLKQEWAEEIYDAFRDNLLGESRNQFMQTLVKILSLPARSDTIELVLWQRVLSTLRHLLLPFQNGAKMSRRAEDLWQQAQILLGEIAEYSQAHHKLSLKHQTEILHLVSRDLGTSFSIGDLIDKVVQLLPELDIPSCYLSLYEDQKAEQSRLILAYHQNRRIEIETPGVLFASPQLIPDGLWFSDKQCALMVEPLYFREKQFGFVLFELGPLEGLIYEILRGELSSDLYGISLFQERKQAERELIQGLTKVNRAMEGAIQSMALTVEMRDLYTAGHQRRVSQLACAIARKMGLPLDQIEGIKLAAIIHDLGKIAVPAEILNKPTKLTEIEFAIMKTHPQIGYDILKNIDFPWPIAQIVLQHHRRINGSGYPPGPETSTLLLEAKIIGVADVVEAMLSHRPYRPGLGLEKALEEISLNRGWLYDPQIVDICVNLFTKGLFEFT